MLAHRLSFPVLGVALLAAAGNWQSAQAQGLAVSPFQLSVNFQRNTTSGNAVSRSLEATGISSDVTVTTTTDGPANANWLFVNPTFMSATGGATRRVDVTLLPAPLSPGSYTGKIRFAPATGAAVEVNVALLVSDARVQNGIPSAFQFVVQRGAPQAPATPLNVTVTTGSLTVTATGSSSPTSWLVVDPVPVNAPGSVNVTVNPASLVPGDYVGSITVNASTLGEVVGNPSMAIPVRLKVVDDSRLTVAPSSISVDHQVNSANPPPRTISVGSTGSTLAFTTEVATPGSATPWMSVTPAGGNTPQSLTVNFQNLTSLQAGTYNGTITVRAGTQTQVVNVTLRLATDPLLTAAPSQMTFTFQQGGAVPPRQTVVLSNFGNPVPITAAPQGTASQWLTVTPAASNTPSALVVGVNATSLLPGILDGNIEVRGAIGNSPYLIPVRLIVSAPAQPLLRVAQNFLNFAFQSGGTAATLSQTLNVSSTGSATITYGTSAVGGAGWLTISPAGTQATPSNPTVSVTPSSLPPGVYTAQVSVQSTEQGATPIVVPVRLVISTQPLISVNPSSLAFITNTTGAPQRQTIAVNSTGTNFPYTAAATVAGGGNWLVIAPGQTTGSTIEVGVNQVVSEGSGLITITAPTAENSPVLVPVTLTTPGSTGGGGTVSNLTVTPNQLDFTAVIGAAAPAAQTLDVSVG
ncbi:MAG: BACON domain-containing protein, partial [Acidobacteria bacterium]|nr:BACON domain-containing protein [Acidobacteriota bacterium]